MVPFYFFSGPYVAPRQPRLSQHNPHTPHTEVLPPSYEAGASIQAPDRVHMINRPNPSDVIELQDLPNYFDLEAQSIRSSALDETELPPYQDTRRTIQPVAEPSNRQILKRLGQVAGFPLLIMVGLITIGAIIGVKNKS